jgi:response regulator RpfG family c-di-GMP phosphodiesterase
MKLTRQPSPIAPLRDDAAPPWKLLVVDDEPDVCTVTRLCLKDFRFGERGLEILQAGSAYEAKAVLAAHNDIAVALIDIVMETDDAGLRLVEYIRKTLSNPMIRIIIRTGQPGAAPERFVIDHYDIDDYKDKTELTATRLYTTVRTAIKSYSDLKIIDLSRAGLSHVLAAAPDIYRLTNTSMSEFFEGVLTQIVGLCRLSESSCIGTLDGIVATIDGQEIQVRAACGNFAGSTRFEEIRSDCSKMILHGHKPATFPERVIVIPLIVESQPVGFIYIEPTRELPSADRNLIMVLAQQCSSALENIRLHTDIKESFDQAIDMLAEVAEFKDKTTGDHIQRIDHYTKAVARELGISEDEAILWGSASRLHDVGKIGIPDALLQKPGKLTAEEFVEIQKHTRIGKSILGRSNFMRIAREVAMHHHERWDGKGYPEGKPSREYSLLTRIVSVVDVFDALVSPRSYKISWSTDDAIKELRQGTGTQFDPTVIAAFMAVHERGEFNHLIESARTAAPTDVIDPRS